MSKSYKTKKEHYRLFKKECRYWLDRFHLGSWRIDFHHINADHDPPGRAWQSGDWEARCCSLGLSVDWHTDKITEYKICSSAFHEVCELLLYIVVCYGETNMNKGQIEELGGHVHAIIRRLEKAIWEPYWESKS